MIKSTIDNIPVAIYPALNYSNIYLGEITRMILKTWIFKAIFGETNPCLTTIFWDGIHLITKPRKNYPICKKIVVNFATTARAAWCSHPAINMIPLHTFYLILPAPTYATRNMILRIIMWLNMMNWLTTLFQVNHTLASYPKTRKSPETTTAPNETPRHLSRFMALRFNEGERRSFRVDSWRLSALGMGDEIPSLKQPPFAPEIVFQPSIFTFENVSFGGWDWRIPSYPFTHFFWQGRRENNYMTYYAPTSRLHVPTYSTYPKYIITKNIKKHHFKILSLHHQTFIDPFSSSDPAWLSYRTDY